MLHDSGCVEVVNEFGFWVGSERGVVFVDLIDFGGEGADFVVGVTDWGEAVPYGLWRIR